jgi:beta-glucanase (GH16 family)
MGVKAKRDPTLREDFEAPRLPIDVAAFHTYAVDWRPGWATFSVDGRPIRSIEEAPDYPLQLMIGVFDFPARASGPDDPAVPELVVSHVHGRPTRDG